MASFGSPFAIGGHRGFGENLLRRRVGKPSFFCPGPRENTLASFRHACKHDVDFVEFDVQVTSDGVPVIFHDDYVVHGNLCTPKRSLISELTLDAFKTTGPLMRWFKDELTHSLVPCDHPWACEEEAELATLAELLDAVPVDVGLNLEIKISTSAALVETPYDEIQRVVDPIVSTLLTAKTQHAVAVSSFDPDVVSYFQSQLPSLWPQYPHMTCWFLSAGSIESLRQDPRRQTLQAAVKFAAEQGMTGVVVHSGELQRDPTVIFAARSAGLMVMSYGIANNDVNWVLRQRDLGVVGVIADDVPSAVAFASARQAESVSDASPRSDVDTVLVPPVLA